MPLTLTPFPQLVVLTLEKPIQDTAAKLRTYYHHIAAMGDLKGDDIFAVLLNAMGKNFEPITSTITVSLPEGDPLVWWSRLNSRWRVIGPFMLCICAVPPLLQVLLQTNHITRCESNVFQHSVVNEVKDVWAKSQQLESVFM
jgi:hypothetical protein